MSDVNNVCPGCPETIKEKETMRKSGSNPNDGENTPPHPPVSWGSVRSDAHVKGNTETKHESAHDSALARLDRGEGPENGGR